MFLKLLSQNISAYCLYYVMIIHYYSIPKLNILFNKYFDLESLNKIKHKM